jgi:shikimate kinase
MAERSHTNILLIGYRSSGKTSVGKCLAGRLGLPFFDTDGLISRRTGKSVKEMVVEKGWEGFRREEKVAIKGLTFLTGSVVALGGGAAMDPGNVAVLKEKGSFVWVWLAADTETIVERMGKDSATEEQRPPLSDGNALNETAALLKEREPVYRVLANIIVDTAGKSVEEIAEEIMKLVAEK